MRLSHLEYVHHTIFAGAIVGAAFLGMVLRYSIVQAEIRGQQHGMIQVYIDTSMRGLSEINI